MKGAQRRPIHLFSSLTWWPIFTVGRRVSIYIKKRRRPSMPQVLRIFALARPNIDFATLGHSLVKFGCYPKEGAYILS
jgi:hypothetical protein